MQRQRTQQPQQPQTVEQYIDSLPDLSGHKRAFLKQHPMLLAPQIVPLMSKHYHAGLRSGLKDDTAELDAFVLDHVGHEIAQQRELTSADARPTPENQERHEQTSHHVEELQREAEAIMAEMKQPPAPPPMRRSVPVSAPVSREVPMAAGGRRPGQMTLNAEERAIAHSSFRHLSKPAAELEYARNKQKMLAMKADGRIQGDHQ